MPENIRISSVHSTFICQKFCEWLCWVFQTMYEMINALSILYFRKYSFIHTCLKLWILSFLIQKVCKINKVWLHLANVRTKIAWRTICVAFPSYLVFPATIDILCVYRLIIKTCCNWRFVVNLFRIFIASWVKDIRICKVAQLQ